MKISPAFERLMIEEATERTGRRITPKSLLFWSVSRNEAQKFRSYNDELVFLPKFEIWCLVKGTAYPKG